MTSQIYRYKFSHQFLQEMLVFVEIHRLDDISVFNEAWKKWVEEHQSITCLENRRLKNIGYEGDVLYKMYKSARYYFKNKGISEKTPKKRRNYIRIDKTILSIMDIHINKMNAGKPAVLYNNFDLKYKELLGPLKANLQEGGLTQDEIAVKLKKTYKNRYFKFITK